MAVVIIDWHFAISRLSYFGPLLPRLLLYYFALKFVETRQALMTYYP